MAIETKQVWIEHPLSAAALASGLLTRFKIALSNRAYRAPSFRSILKQYAPASDASAKQLRGKERAAFEPHEASPKPRPRPREIAATRSSKLFA
jgi:hypothetical protein